MIEKILELLEDYKYTHLVERDKERLEHCTENERAEHCEGIDCFWCVWDKAISIVQEVAKEYAEPKEPSRCVTCANYDGEEIVDNICYLCWKGFEDNYKVREGE